MSIKDKLIKINNQIGTTKLIAVTKYASVEQMKELYEAGQHIFGESKVQALRDKLVNFEDMEIEWHLIGHLQTNKAKYAVKMFEMIQSIDSLKLAKEIDKEAKKINKVQKILVQINIGSEEQKFGIEPDKASELIKQIKELSNIKVCGLMAMAPYLENPEETRPYFKKMKELFDSIGDLEYLSLGMTHDYEVALEEGSNMIRLGSALLE